MALVRQLTTAGFRPIKVQIYRSLALKVLREGVFFCCKVISKSALLSQTPFFQARCATGTKRNKTTKHRC